MILMLGWLLWACLHSLIIVFIRLPNHILLILLMGQDKKMKIFVVMRQMLSISVDETKEDPLNYTFDIFIVVAYLCFYNLIANISK